MIKSRQQSAETVVTTSGFALTGSMFLTLTSDLLRLSLVFVFVTLQLLQVISCNISNKFKENALISTHSRECNQLRVQQHCASNSQPLRTGETLCHAAATARHSLLQLSQFDLPRLCRSALRLALRI